MFNFQLGFFDKTDPNLIIRQIIYGKRAKVNGNIGGDMVATNNNL